MAPYLQNVDLLAKDVGLVVVESQNRNGLELGLLLIFTWVDRTVGGCSREQG